MKTINTIFIVVGIILLFFIGCVSNTEKEEPQQTISLEDKKNANKILEVGIKHLKNKDYYEAIEKFNIALDIDPTLAPAYNNRANAKFYTNDFNGALKDYNQAIKINKDNMHAYYNRAIVRLRVAEKKSCQDFEKALQLGHPEAEKQLLENCIEK